MNFHWLRKVFYLQRGQVLGRTLYIYHIYMFVCEDAYMQSSPGMGGGGARRKIRSPQGGEARHGVTGRGAQGRRIFKVEDFSELENKFERLFVMNKDIQCDSTDRRER
jgi:hypothetical protein